MYLLVDLCMSPVLAKGGLMYLFEGVLHCSVVKCVTCNQGVLGLNHSGSFGYFVGVSLGKTLSEPQPSIVENQERQVM